MVDESGLPAAAQAGGTVVDGNPAFTIPWPTLAVFVVAAVLAGILAAVSPARRAGRLDVLAALQYE